MPFLDQFTHFVQDFSNTFFTEVLPFPTFDVHERGSDFLFGGMMSAIPSAAVTISTIHQPAVKLHSKRVKSLNYTRHE